MAMNTTIKTSLVSSSIVLCHECKQPLEEPGQPVALLSSTGQFRDGIEVFRITETVYECSACAYADLLSCIEDEQA